MITAFQKSDVARERVLLEEGRLQAAADLLGNDAISGRVGPHVAAGLIQLLQRQRAELAPLLAQDGSGTSWSSLRNRVRANDRLLSECVALISGAYARPAPGLANSCAEAEIVVRDLSAVTGMSSTRLVIPADTECVSLASSVLRRRFPDHGIWDLPIVAHELGHLAERDLIEVDLIGGGSSRPLAELLAGKLRQTAELAADVFAIYTIGPAYAMTLILHRMDPTAPAATTSDATHPSDAARVAAAVHSLELLDKADVDARGQYKFIIDGLREFWSNAQEKAPSEARLDEDAAARVRRDVEQTWTRISGSRLTSARYTTFVRARDMARDFQNRVDSDRAPRMSLDVVNAAWLVRFRSWRDGMDCPREVVEWARRHIMNSPSEVEGH
jgi:hypothetical protein